MFFHNKVKLSAESNKKYTGYTVLKKNRDMLVRSTIRTVQ